VKDGAGRVLRERNKIDQHEFGDFVEDEKHAVGRPNSQNYTWDELQDLATKFKLENGIE
jgi:hypothetical protein